MIRRHALALLTLLCACQIETVDEPCNDDHPEEGEGAGGMAGAGGEAEGGAGGEGAAGGEGGADGEGGEGGAGGALPERCGAVYVDGLDDLVQAAPSGAYDAPASSTIEAWIYPTALPGSGLGVIAAHHIEASAALGSYILYLDSSGRLVLTGIVGTSYGPSFLASTDVIPLGEWTHVAGVFDGPNQTATLFVNGSPSGSAATPTTSVNQTPSAPFTMGRYPDESSIDLPYAGYIDEVRLSKVVRYAAPFVPEASFMPDANTAALFHFDKGGGATAMDASSMMGPATLFNGALFASPDCP